MPNRPVRVDGIPLRREPLLANEKKLIGWSIGIGVALLGILVWVSYTYFPAGH